MNNYSSYPYTSAHGRARLTKWLLIAGALIAVISICVTALEFVFPSITSEEELSENPLAVVVVLLQLGVGLLQLGVLIATVVSFLMWLYRSYNNLPSFGHRPGSIAYSAGWAVGSFFVPFVNLVVPYRAVKELWRKSEPLTSELFADVSPPALFPIWWTFWLLSNFAANAYYRIEFRGDISPEIAAIASMVADALAIIAAIFAIVVINEIDQRQEAAQKSLALGQPSEPPPPPSFEPAPETAAFRSN